MNKRMSYLKYGGLAAALIGLLGACEPTDMPRATLRKDEAYKERVEAGKALYEEKCKTVAGEKIYKTVPDVEGIVLLKVRPSAGDTEWRDPLWPGAAFAREATGDEYLNTFLGYEHSSSTNGKPVRPEYRGYISPNFQPDNPSNLPGYRFVDVIDENNGKWYRYKTHIEEPWQYDKSYRQGYIKYSLDKIPAPESAPRYGVTFEDHVIPEERVLGLASSTVKVVDLQTNEVLGEMLRYAWSRRAETRVAWLSAYRCPDHAVGTSASTRKFVDQVLLPKK